jgi:hypothetical protein
MHLYNLFESTTEAYTVTRGIDQDRYQQRSGLEGPFQTKSGKVVYYDAKQGQYYDPDTDRYIDYDDYRALDEDPTQEEPVSDTMRKQPAQEIDVYEQQVDEGAREFVTGALLAGLLGLGVQQLGSISDAKNSPLGRAMAQAAEQGDQYAAKHLDKLDFYFDANDTGSIKVLSKKYLGRVVEGVVSEAEIATSQKTQRMVNLMRARYPEAKTDLEALLLHFNTGQRQDRQDISTLYTQNDEEEQEIDQLQAALDKIKSRAKMGIATEAADSDRQRALDASMAELERQFGPLKKVKYAAPSEEELRAKAAKAQAQQAERSKQRMERAQQLIRKYGVKIEPGHEGYFLKGVSDGRGGVEDRRAGDAYGPYVGAYDAGVSVGRKMRSTTNEDYYETDEQRELARLGRIIMDIGAKRDDAVGVAMGAVGMELTKYGTPQGASNIRKLEQVTGQPESVIMKMMALAQKVQGDVARGEEVPDEEELDDVNEADFDANFSKRVGATVRGGAGAEYLKKKADQRKAANPDAGKGLGPGVLDVAKARKKAAAKGVRPGSLRASPNTRDPERLPEAAETDIQIGDTVQTIKMGQIPGTVTGFSKKSGITKVLFKHESGKTYASVPSNLRVISSKKTEGSNSLNEFDLYGAYEDYVRMPDGSYLKIKYRSTGQPDTQYSTQSFIGKPEPVDPATVQRLQLDKRVPGYHGLDQKPADLGGASGFGHEYGSKNPFASRDIGVTDYENTQPAIKKALTQYLAQDVNEAKKKPIPTKPDKWAYAKSQAKEKFDVYPSAYANAWAAKKYKELGGGWRMGTKEDLEEMEQLEELKCWPGYERVPGTTAGEPGSCRKK